MIGIANDPAKVDLGVTVVFADLCVPDTSGIDGSRVSTSCSISPPTRALWRRGNRSSRNNVDLSLNVLDAAHRHGVKRVVFASSNWVLAGYRFRPDPLTPTTPPLPVNAYGGRSS